MLLATRFLCVVCLSVGVTVSAHGASLLTGGSFPTTINDVPANVRMENKRVGYEPYKDASPYSVLPIESAEAAMQRQVNLLEEIRKQEQLSMSQKEYCDKYPLDDEYCPQRAGLEQEVAAIGDGTSSAQPADTQNQTLPPVTVQNTGDTSDTNWAIVANNRVHGQKCTPSAYSTHFRNEILTSGKYESIDPAFEKAMVQIFRMEGECGGHPADSGGYTCYGFAQNANPDIDVRKLTRPAAEDRTYTKRYQAHGIDKLPDSVRGDVLRGQFNAGAYGVQQLEKTLNLPLTRRGNVTDEMVRAAENYNGDLHNAYWDSMQQYYINLAQRKPRLKVFLKGWMNGVKLMRENGCHVVPERPLTR